MGDRHLSFWPVTAPRQIPLPETSLWYNLEVSATRFPNKNALVFYDGLISYAALKQAAEAIAGYLQQRCGVKPGDRVGIYTQNCPHFVMAFYGILRAGGMVVPINPMSVSAEVAYMLQDSGAQVIVTTQELFPQLQPLLDQGVAKHVIVGALSDYVPDDTDLTLPPLVAEPARSFSGPGVKIFKEVLTEALTPGPELPSPDDFAVMPYTSGTTGNPKGCIHTHRTVMHSTLITMQWRPRFQDECALGALPLFHVTGMQNAMNGPIFTGGTSVLLPRWDRDVAAKLIARYRITGWTTVPTMVVDLLSSPKIAEYDLSSLRAMGGGGAAMPEAIATKLEQVYGLQYIEGYGLSETMAPTHINPEHRPKKQCLGIPTSGVDSRVVDPDTLEELPANQTGEILIHGPQVFQGYWNRPEATGNTFVEVDGKRFFRTGDLGFVDNDGYFFIVDRLKRMINASGFKVWPAEIEAKLYAHPGVKEAAIISRPDPRRGETVKAVVVRNENATLEEQELIEWCRGCMSAYKVPRSVEFVDALPKSGSGKILWRVLQDKENQATAD